MKDELEALWMGHWQLEPGNMRDAVPRMAALYWGMDNLQCFETFPLTNY